MTFIFQLWSMTARLSMKYANDEYHCSVVKSYMHSVVSASVTVDFEF